jgi:hypothetical protein
MKVKGRLVQDTPERCGGMYVVGGDSESEPYGFASTRDLALVFAAAPELLDALTGLANYVSSAAMSLPGDDYQPHVKKAREAIKKAKGWA